MNYHGAIHYKSWGFHLAGWMIYLTIEVGALLLSGLQTGKLIESIPFYLCNIALFYAVILILQRYPSENRHHVAWAVFSIACAFACCEGVKLLIEYLFLFPRFPEVVRPKVMRQYIIGDLYRSMTFTFLAVMVWLAFHLGSFRKQAAEAYSAFLQQQLNPHLLFNTLTFVHSKIFRVSPAAGDAVMLLSDIIRYGMEASGEDAKAPLVEEVEQYHNLIELNRHRFGDSFHVQFSVGGDLSHHRILPLSLLTLGENLFKHGDFSHPDTPAKIHLTINENRQLIYRSENAKKAGGTQVPRAKAIGLTNLLLRLDTIYPGQYVLHIDENENTYHVNFTIQL